jgi:hypothetical protein
MKQGDTKKLAPKDRHKSAWWKRRDDSRKAKQEAFAASVAAITALADEHDAQTEMAADDAAEAGEEARATR